MTEKQIPTADECDAIRRLVSYEPSTGDFRWIWCPKRKRADVPAGTVNSAGYLVIGIGWRRFRAHRIAWLIMTGEFPPPDMAVDHINGDVSDNRWANLRLATPSQNQWNRKLHRSNKSGVSGVRFIDGIYEARIQANRTPIQIGRFETFEEASDAVRRARELFHGEFYRREVA